MRADFHNLIGNDCLNFDRGNDGTSFRVSRYGDFIGVKIKKNFDFDFRSRYESPYGMFSCSFEQGNTSNVSKPFLTFVPKTGDTKLKIKLDQTNFGVIPIIELKSPIKIGKKEMYVESKYSRGKNDFAFGTQFSIEKINTVIDFVYEKSLYSKIFISYPFVNQAFLLSAENIVSETNIGSPKLFGSFKYSQYYDAISYFCGILANYDVNKASLVLTFDNKENGIIKFTNETKICNQHKIGFSIINDFDKTTLYNIGCSLNIKGINTKLKFGNLSGPSVSFSKCFDKFEFKTCISSKTLKVSSFPSLSFSIDIK